MPVALWIAIGILSILLFCLAGYLCCLQVQIRSIIRQLDRRLTEHTRQPVTLGLFSPVLNRLANKINQGLKAEENLRLAVVREEKNFKEMIANISHDLRTPLTAIKGYQQLLANSGLREDQQNKLQIAQKHADELGTLIEQFFEYSYVLNSDSKPVFEKINLTNLTADSLAESVVALEERNLTICFEESAPVFVRADRTMVMRILQNLIRNSLQHSQGNIQVRIFAEQKAVISFQNSVTDPDGIEPSRLFDRFYTAQPAKGRSSGLGLAIVRLLAEQMGGTAAASLRENLLEIRVELPLFD